MRKNIKIWAFLLALVTLISILAVSPFAEMGDIQYCPNCDGDHTYTLEYESVSEDRHFIRLWCHNCGDDICRGFNAEGHTVENGVCIYCGYDDGTGDICQHGNTASVEAGCDNYTLCYDCGETFDHYISHKSIVDVNAGCDWSSVCEVCGDVFETWVDHETVVRYETYDFEYHLIGEYCTVCEVYVAEPYYEAHTTVSVNEGCTWYEVCEHCGQDVNSWVYHSNYSYSDFTYHDSDSHKYTKTCLDCGEESVEYGSHNTAVKYHTHDAVAHRKQTYCVDCQATLGNPNLGFENHVDSNGDNKCDKCNYSLFKFSVTVPASLNIVVSKDGQTYCPTNSRIVNNSTVPIRISKITLEAKNGWRIVPFEYDMASAKVDSCLIGFSICGSATAKEGEAEELVLSSAVSEKKVSPGSSFLLEYGAVVSAYSEPVDTQVLSIIFVIDRAD